MNNALLIGFIGASALLLSACAASPSATATPYTHQHQATQNPFGAIGTPIVAQILSNQCQIQLQNQPMWQHAQNFLGTKAEQVKARTCDCVGNEAVKVISTSDILGAAVDDNKRNEVLARVVSQALPTCASTALQSYLAP